MSGAKVRISERGDFMSGTTDRYEMIPLPLDETPKNIEIFIILEPNVQESYDYGNPKSHPCG